ncbi:uncharacterized protein C2845_PM15G07960 [Panicum miliaceum]|uniref:U-box domain-containing protein n=1 Tax=Panicum miliaceum TaxID=4540 RepID=A0A3L6Q8Y0_PANMI|nr:uncharacterized protein C2845_PM15G07960 [Panicum miliaceum]
MEGMVRRSSHVVIPRLSSASTGGDEGGLDAPAGSSPSAATSLARLVPLADSNARRPSPGVPRGSPRGCLGLLIRQQERTAPLTVVRDEVGGGHIHRCDDRCHDLHRWSSGGDQNHSPLGSIGQLGAAARGQVTELGAGEIHEFTFWALDDAGRRRCLGGDYFEVDLSGAAWKSTGGDGSYFIRLQTELFECAFRAMGNASAGELHHGADARRRSIGPVVVPQFFVCPVSNKIMENSVVITSGKTVDRSALEEWRKEHRSICPVTGKVLVHTMFIPSILIKLCIERWRAANKIPGVMAASDPPSISPRGGSPVMLFMQVTMMPHSPISSNEVRDALFLLHDLLNEESSAVHLIGSHPGTTAKLASVLPKTCLEPDLELDDIIAGVMAKAASYGPNKAVFGDDQYAIPVLIVRALLPM